MNYLSPNDVFLHHISNKERMTDAVLFLFHIVATANS